MMGDNPPSHCKKGNNMPNVVYNSNKTADQYIDQPLFFGEQPGLFDTINKKHPQLWELYKTMKSLDWDENEFDYSSCNIQFKTCPKSTADMMIYSLAWQWGSDSVASRAIAPVMAPFISDSSLWAAWQRISDNEIVHASTYSEIVRMSFDDPAKVLGEILQIKESLARMDSVTRTLSDLYWASHQYALGLISEEDAYDKLMMGIIALLLLERLQFTASFSITFTICSTGLFQPIGKAVQKIAQDELEVHAELDKAVLRIELATERGKKFYEKYQPAIKQLCDEVVETELRWTDYLFSEGRELVGANASVVKNFVLFNAKDVYTFLGIKSDYKFPKHNPMPHIEDWINIGNVQSAPQTQDNNSYKVNTLTRDDTTVIFDIDF